MHDGPDASVAPRVERRSTAMAGRRIGGWRVAAALATVLATAPVAWAETGAGTLASAPVRVGGAGRGA